MKYKIGIKKLISINYSKFIILPRFWIKLNKVKKIKMYMEDNKLILEGVK